MFENIFQDRRTIARHRRGPHLGSRRRYLEFCVAQRETRGRLASKAAALLRIAEALRAYSDLRFLTEEQLAAATRGGVDSLRRTHADDFNQLMSPRVSGLATEWMRFLRHWPDVRKVYPFQGSLEAYCQWARDERGFTPATISQARWQIKTFLCWFSKFDRSLRELAPTDIDEYLAYQSNRAWCRRSINKVTGFLRMFLRYAAQRNWTQSDLAITIQAPRIYEAEGLPAGPDWRDVRRMFDCLDPTNPKDIRDRCILMLMAVYGLRVSEVKFLKLDHVDWEHNLLHVARSKRRGTQDYPLLSSIAQSLERYIVNVRHRSTVHREVFLSLAPPFRPISSNALYCLVKKRLAALGVRTAHQGPHCLRHACAARLVAEGLSLKEIGDHLGHRSTSSTRIYAKVDLRGLREVASFDLGDVL